MHRHRTSLLPIISGQRSHSARKASTAANLKPRTEWAAEPESVAPPAPNLSKWARPAPAVQTKAPASSSFAARQPSSSAPNWNAPDRARPERSSNGQDRGSRKGSAGNASTSKWARDVPPSSNAAGRFASGSGLNRWTQPSQPPARTPSSSGSFQRDVAPHQEPTMGTDFLNIGGKLRPTNSRAPVGPTPRRGGDSLDSRSTDTRQMNPVRAKDPQRKGNDASSSRRVVYDATPVATTGELEKDSRRRDRERFKSRGSLVSHTYGENATLGATRSSSAGASSNTASNVRRAKQRARPRIEVYIPTVVSVGMLARLLKVRLETLQRKMAQAGMGQESHYDYVLTSDYAVLLAEEFNRKPIVSDEAAFDIYPSPTHPNPSTLPARPPVVTIMGHVDHGKTTLLDTLRHSAVAKGEAGGITQHIGAFSVPVPSGNAQGPQSITFLDTPGHAAFSAMRARGASVTDIIVLVVAADDGVMPQTKEVIELIRKDAGKVGVVVAINKVDKLGADVEKVQMALVQEGIQLESIGGDVPSVEVSGLTGQGLDTLVETLSLMAEMQDLHAERDGPAHGYVLESRVEKGLGPVATVLVTRGCLKTAAHIISGTSQAKVRIMKDQVGAAVKAAYPGMAVTVSGWKELPSAGDEVLQGSEADVKKALANRVRKEKVEATLVDVEAINVNRREERERKEIEDKDAKTRQGLASAPVEEVEHGPRQLRLVVKGDVSGSVEAVVGAIESIGNKDAVVKIVSNGVGDVSETDVMMAKTAGAMIVAFSVNVPRAMEVLAAQNEVPIYSTPIIYRLMDEVRDRIIALLPKTIETTVTGEANVLQLFDVSVKGKITKKVAGCRVSNGIADKANKARVVRNGTIVHAGTIETLRYLKKDVTEIRKGSECGMAFTQFEDIREGDLIQFYREVEVPGVL